MENVYVNALKLELVKLTFKRRVERKADCFASLESLLEDTKGRKDYKAFPENEMEAATPIHINPSDEVLCAEAISVSLRRKIAQSKADTETKQVCIDYVKEWLESVKQRNQVKDTKSKEQAQQTEKANKLNPDFLKGYRTKLNNCVKNGWLIENGDYYRACKGGTNKLAFILGVLWGGDYIENGVIEKGFKDFPAKELERYFGIKTLSDKRSKLSLIKKTQIYEKIYRTINI